MVGYWQGTYFYWVANTYFYWSVTYDYFPVYGAVSPHGWVSLDGIRIYLG